MKEALYNVFVYVIAFGFVYYQTYAEADWSMTILATILLIGFANIVATALVILWHGLVWFWDATVNYSKNRKEYKEDEI